MDRKEILEKDDWSGANLQGVSLGFCDLRGKNFRGADLSHAHLGCADLRGADLRNANLIAANLGAADLRGADMRLCDLRDANLSEAKLAGADLRQGLGKTYPNSKLWTDTLWVETEEYKEAKEAGYFPVSYWGDLYQVEGAGTLHNDKKNWAFIKKKIGVLVFGDQETFAEVKLVQQYMNYAQWAYMVTRKGFERMIQQLGMKANPK